jgi:hypothetical protein
VTDIYATVIVPVGQLDSARIIGGNQWGFIRALTSDTDGAPPPTHYVSSGQADAALLALIVNLPGVIVNYDQNAPAMQVISSAGLRFVVWPEDE